MGDQKKFTKMITHTHKRTYHDLPGPFIAPRPFIPSPVIVPSPIIAPRPVIVPIRPAPIIHHGGAVVVHSGSSSGGGIAAAVILILLMVALVIAGACGGFKNLGGGSGYSTSYSTGYGSSYGSTYVSPTVTEETSSAYLTGGALTGNSDSVKTTTGHWGINPHTGNRSWITDEATTTNHWR